MTEIIDSSLLERLGLTEYESKTLSTLFKLKEAEAPDISRIAQVPKTRVYDVLDKLTEKGLVIEISGRPKNYRVVEPSKAIDLLVETKKFELKDLESQAFDLKKKLSSSDKMEDEKGEKIMKVKDKLDFDKILAQELEKAKTSVHGFSDLRDENVILKDAIEKAKNRNVSIKILNHSPTELSKRYARDGTIELKHCDHGLNAYIIDGKKVVMALSDFKKEKPEYHFTIWNEHKPIVNALQHYFDKNWAECKSVK